MKRILKIAALVVLLVVVAVAGLFAVTFMGRQSLADGYEINRVRVVADGFSGMAIIRLDDGRVALVDAGDDPEGAAVLAELQRRQLGPEAVAAVLLTHGHPDHLGAIARFPRAEVMALEAEVPLVEGRAGARGPLPRLFPVSPTGVKVTRVLRDGDVVTVGGVPIRVYAVPGHTGGSAAYYVDGALLVGDSADIASDGSLQGAPWIFSDSQAENRASLVRLERRLVADGAAVKAIVPAHSGAGEGAALTSFARTNRERP
ncbi:MAG: MBL fold metallo-hydrolase [Acidobacteria bacterium]|nr:MBL fold metallo-hydrolase [Acidobacteriota bacterium]